MQEQFMGELELICIKIVIDKQKPFFLVTWYRPPDSHNHIFEKFESFLEYLDSCGLDFFILGDLNCDVSRTPHHCHTKRLFSLASNYNMKQFIEKPTRVTANSSSTIDLLFSSNSNRVQFCDVVPITVSDHFMIIASLGKIKPPPSQHKYVTYRDFKKMDSSAFYNDLDNLSWSAVLSETDAEIAYNKLISIYKDVLNVHAPIKRKRIRKKSAPWINEQILTMMKERDASKEKARLTGDPQDWCKYKQLRNRVTAKRRKFKREYVTRTILENTGNSGEIWKLLGKILPSNKKHDSLKSLNINGRDITDSKEIADYMNDYFANITKKLKDTAQFEKNNLTAASTNCLSEFSFESVTSSHVLKCLNEIPKKKSAGLDGIPTFILKDSASYIIRPLLHIINISLSQGRVPSGWKVAKLTPLYKGGSFKDPTNYRPISVLPVLSKVMEKVVFKQVYKYITDNNLLSDNQFGFRPGYSTNTALFTITENIRKKVDQGYVVGLVTLDLKKAFDMVSHEILLYKLKNFGFDDLSVSWFRDYLSFRKHTTNINNNLSDFCPVTCGVPQGSILGPLLFIIFINDISKVVKFSNISMYADDTCIYYASDNSNDLCSCLNEDLCKLSQWLKCNELLLNPKKCEFITFGSHRKLLSFANAHIHIDGERINRVQECKYLGVILNSSLNWNAHIKFVKTKAIKSLYCLKRIRPFITKNTAIMLYRALFQPHFDYCSIVWFNAGKVLIKELCTLQNRALRLILGVDALYSTSLLYFSIDIAKLELRWKRQAVSFIFKLLHGLLPLSLCSRISLKESKYSLRNCECKIYLDKPRTNYLRHGGLYRGIQIFNSLPCNIRQINDLSVFNKAINFIAL